MKQSRDNFIDTQKFCIKQVDKGEVTTIETYEVRLNVNPFPSEGFPIDESNRLALDRVKSVSALTIIWQLRG